MKCTQYYKIHNTEPKRYLFKTLNKYNAYINDMHFTYHPARTHSWYCRNSLIELGCSPWIIYKYGRNNFT